MVGEEAPGGVAHPGRTHPVSVVAPLAGPTSRGAALIVISAIVLGAGRRVAEVSSVGRGRTTTRPYRRLRLGVGSTCVVPLAAAVAQPLLIPVFWPPCIFFTFICSPHGRCGGARSWAKFAGFVAWNLACAMLLLDVVAAFAFLLRNANFIPAALVAMACIGAWRSAADAGGARRADPLRDRFAKGMETIVPLRLYTGARFHYHTLTSWPTDPSWRLGSVKDVAVLRDHLAQLGLGIPCDDALLGGDVSPLAQPAESPACGSATGSRSTRWRVGRHARTAGRRS